MTPSAAAGLRCPHCGKPLLPLPGVLRCPFGHSFDLAREGYANLLAVHRRHSKEPGDSREMVVARHRFLQQGHYALFAQYTAQLAADHASAAPRVVDAGCGDGYYTAAVAAALAERGTAPAVIGFDLSKPAVRLAAKALPDAAMAVATSYAIPVADGWADLLLNIFSPMAHEEFYRVLKPGGILIYAVPTARHLFGMKAVLYPSPYLNEEKTVDYPGFTAVEERRAEGQLHLQGQAVQDLFAMTPYYWKTPEDGSRRLAALEQLNTEIGFRFLVFRKE